MQSVVCADPYEIIMLTIAYDFRSMQIKKLLANDLIQLHIVSLSRK